MSPAMRALLESKTTNQLKRMRRERIKAMEFAKDAYDKGDLRATIVTDCNVKQIGNLDTILAERA